MKLIKFKKMQLNIGIRLVAAGVMLACGNFIMAALCMVFPGWTSVPGILATGLTAEEEVKQKALVDKILAQVKVVTDNANTENVNKKELDARIEKINKEIEKLTNDGMAELKKKMDDIATANEELKKTLADANETIKNQGAALKKITDKGVEDTSATVQKSFREALKEAFMSKKDTILSEKNDDFGKRLSLKDFFDKGNRTTGLVEVKALVDMFESNIVGNNVATIRLTELDPQRVGIPLTIYPHVTSVFRVKGITRPYMSLLVVYEYEDGAATKTEGGASTKSSFKLKTVEFKAFFIATHFVMSDETLDDLEEVLDEISVVAPDKIMDEIDEQILGSAGNDTTAIAGILTATKNTAYAAPAAMALLVDTPYIVDVIAAAKLQCETNKYKPNVVYLNPGDVALLQAAKNTLEDSKSDRRVAFGANGEAFAVCGLRIIQSTAIVANTCIVLDNAQPWIGRRKDMTIEIGYNGTDLTEGQKTIVIKIRVAFGVRDKAAVIYVSNILTAITGLTKPA